MEKPQAYEIFLNYLFEFSASELQEIREDRELARNSICIWWFSHTFYLEEELHEFLSVSTEIFSELY